MGDQTWILKLSHANGKPLIWLDRPRNPGLPAGETVFTANGREYTGRFVKIALNFASTAGEPGNALHALLRGWFGELAGLPGTRMRVELERAGSRYTMRPHVPAE